MDPEMEEQMAQLENSLGLEQQRLEKLWDAYEQQEKDLNASLDRINILESEIETKETMISSLQELLTEIVKWDGTTRVGLLRTDKAHQVMHPSQNINSESRVINELITKDQNISTYIEKRNLPLVL